MVNRARTVYWFSVFWVFGLLVFNFFLFFFFLRCGPANMIISCPKGLANSNWTRFKTLRRCSDELIFKQQRTQWKSHPSSGLMVASTPDFLKRAGGSLL